MTPLPPETLSLAGMGCVALFGLVKLLRAHRSGALRRPAGASGQ